MTGAFVNMLSLFYQWGPQLLIGAANTLALLLLSAFLGLIFSMAAGLARLARRRIVRVIATIYVEIFRGVSVVVTLFWIYFALPFLGVSLSPWSAAVLALALVHGAYASEYVRSTILAIPRAQTEAATALSMSRLQCLRYVIFPQAFARMMPLYANELILLLKATSVASLISVPELTEEGRSILVATYKTLPSLLSVLLIYFFMAQGLLWCVRRMERRVTRWRSAQELNLRAAPVPSGAAPRFGFRV